MDIEFSFLENPEYSAMQWHGRGDTKVKIYYTDGRSSIVNMQGGQTVWDTGDREFKSIDFDD